LYIGHQMSDIFCASASPFANRYKAWEENVRVHTARFGMCGALPAFYHMT